MIIGKIKDGIVLDHITAGRGMEIYKILGLDKLDCTVAIIKNAKRTNPSFFINTSKVLNSLYLKINLEIFNCHLPQCQTSAFRTV